MLKHPVISIIDDDLSLRETVPDLMRARDLAPYSDDAHYRRPARQRLALALGAGVACDLTKPSNETELFSCITRFSGPSEEWKEMT